MYNSVKQEIFLLLIMLHYSLNTGKLEDYCLSERQLHLQNFTYLKTVSSSDGVYKKFEEKVKRNQNFLM